MASGEGKQIKKPLRLRLLTNDTESYDSLYHTKEYQPTICQKEVCLGSVLYQHVAKATFQARPVDEVLVHAKDFLDQYFASIKRTNQQAHKDRWNAVQEEVKRTGTYQLTETELAFGAKLAWRNAPRCIGRIQYARLQVFDCRSVTTTSGMFEALCNHIKYATNKGNIRSAITVFPQRTDGKHDFKVWNSQLLAYAGYKNADGSFTGDPINAEFTEMVMKLGWKGKRGRWDILPLVLSANGKDPDYFDIPEELVLRIPLTHPKYEWFADLELQWYAVPAVASMMFDCGGLQFTAAPFNGWYMGTEIGARDLCDSYRYNMLEPVAKKMGLNTNSLTTLWKDQALVECNIAVLHSFQLHNATIVDHHTASESFMKHLENENRLRQGCPADWVWLVPPISGSISPLFHQEMAHYNLFPAYAYQEQAWKVHQWEDKTGGGRDPDRVKRKFHFKQIARAVKFTSRLFRKALSKRIKATILFATETGTSESFAKKLNEICAHAFNSQVVRMDEYDISNMEHEALLLVVCSTFGNGDPPEMGKVFFQQLTTLRREQGNSSAGSPDKVTAQTCRASVTDTDNFGLLSNVRFAVFALGSSAFPNFCSFGINVDRLVGELGGERLMKVTLGDEMHGQQQTFTSWAPEIFKIACDVFCLDQTPDGTTTTTELPLTTATVRFVNSTATDLKEALAKAFGRQVYKTTVAVNRNLHGSDSSITTLGVELNVVGLKYEPGDHVGVFPLNNKDLVDGVLSHLDLTGLSPDKPMELQLLKETQTIQGVAKRWDPHEKLPRASLRDMLTRFCDLTTPPIPEFLEFLATCTNDPEDKENLLHLAKDPSAYEDWRHWRFPHMLEVLEQFSTVRPAPALFVARLSQLQPRIYSLSSSPLIYPSQVHLTVGVVTYRTQDGKGPMHYGVCSNYLKGTKQGDEVFIFGRSAPNFHLPEDVSLPMVLVGPGTGIAPFRGFWQHREALQRKHGSRKMGKITLFFGARLRALDLYRDEKQKMIEEGIFDKVLLALSREKTVPKTYVQNLMIGEAKSIYKKIVTDKGHFYVCGDVTMAEGVWITLKTIIQTEGSMTPEQVNDYMDTLKSENRVHEDIFGITLRTKEVHNRSREAARIRMASQSNP